MMMRSPKENALRYLQRKYGCTLSDAVFAHADDARDWWAGKHEPFHVFTEMRQGLGSIKREMFCMGMAKKVCEDWATVQVNDRTNIRCEDETVSSVLFGDRHGMGGILTSNNFWGRLHRFTEETFALGTGAAVARFSGAVCDADGMLSCADEMKLSFYAADRIFPLATEDGEIVSCAFLGGLYAAQKTGDGNAQDAPLLTIHEKRGPHLWAVENVLLRVDARGDVRAAAPPNGILRRFFVPQKLFAILTPNIVPTDANLREHGLGASVYDTAYDNLKGVDLAYNNFCRDLFLGGKKVFMNQNLVQEDGYGRRIAPDDVAQQLFVTVGDGDLSGETMIVEHNPALRAEENAKAVQAQLDYLSFKVGLGTRRYRFSGESVVTATQYAGDRQELLQYAMKHALHMESFLRTLSEIAYYYASTLCGLQLPPPGRYTVDFDDSFFIDPSAERARDLREFEAGLMTREEFREKYYER